MVSMYKQVVWRFGIIIVKMTMLQLVKDQVALHDTGTLQIYFDTKILCTWEADVKPIISKLNYALVDIVVIIIIIIYYYIIIIIINLINFCMLAVSCTEVFTSDFQTTASLSQC